MSPRALSRFTTRVFLRGEDVGVHEVSWSAAITNDLPGRFTAGDGVPQRTGRIDWRPTGLLVDGISPMSAGYPKPGDSIKVVAEVQVSGKKTPYTVFTGRVDQTSGGMGEPLVSEIIDLSDDLNSSVGWYSLLATMPKRQNTNWSTTYPGCYITYPLAEVAKQCGFGPSYPTFGGSIFFYAHLNGSFMTDFLASEGALVRAASQDSYGSSASGTTFNTGDASNNNFKGYNAGLYQGSAVWDINQTSVAQNGMWIDLEIAKDGYPVIGVRFRDGTTLTLNHDAGGNAFVKLDGETSSTINYRGFNYVPDNLLQFASVGLYYPPSVGQSIWLRCNDKFYETSLKRKSSENNLVSTTPDITYTNNNGPIFASSQFGCLRNIIMGRMPSGSTVEDWKRDMLNRTPQKVNFRVSAQKLAYIPSRDNVTGKSAISEVCAATGIASWVDSNGNLQFWSGDQLRKQTPEFTLSESDYSPLSWDTNYQHGCKVVTVKSKDGIAQTDPNGDAVFTAWQGNTSEAYQRNSPKVDWFTIGDDADYLEVDTTPKNLNALFESKSWFATPTSKFKNSDFFSEPLWHGKQSVFSASWQGETTDGVDNHIAGKYLSAKVDRISKRTYKVTHSAYTGDRATMSPSINTILGLGQENQGMPIIRAGAKVDIVDADPVKGYPAGAPGPELIMDMGVWCTKQTREAMRDMLVEYFNSVHPVFKDVETLFDPRIDVGKMITIDATKKWGHKFNVLITGVKHDPVDGKTTFTPRVISLVRTGRNYGQLASDYGYYSALEGVTYQQVEDA